jgi:preprotein translocase subunit SecD
LPVRENAAQTVPPPTPTAVESPTATVAANSPIAESAEPSRNEAAPKRRINAPRIRPPQVEGSGEAIEDPAPNTARPLAPEDAAEKETPPPEEPGPAPDPAPGPPKEGEDSEFRYGI